MYACVSVRMSVRVITGRTGNEQVNWQVCLPGPTSHGWPVRVYNDRSVTTVFWLSVSDVENDIMARRWF